MGFLQSLQGQEFRENGGVSDCSRKLSKIRGSVGITRTLALPTQLGTSFTMKADNEPQ